VRVLVVGGGGREHALCWGLARDPAVERVHAAPGNVGIGELASLVPVAAADVEGIARFAERESIDLTVVGPEGPMVAGLADELRARGLPVFGPSRAGARIEGSKAWARELCERHGIPGPRSRRFDRIGPAEEYLEGIEGPIVVKADGLAAGKGVTVASSRREARRALRDCLVNRAFGDAGGTVLIEQCLEGPEVSALALVGGGNVEPLVLAQDYKRAGDGNEGPNTGGMGAYSPVPFVDPETEARILHGILKPAAAALQREGVDYRGVLYAGLMLTADGPKVLEFNCRFGDPETQVILPRLASGLGRALLACAEGRLDAERLEWRTEACVGVVAASDGYPGTVETGKPISGLPEAASMRDVMVFHSGTARRDGRVVTAGGRVITVAALGPSLEEARARAYEAVAAISFDGMWFRTDLAGELPQGAAR
jgi:phosphoribosylamine---glycine ligase